jgi:heme exporter protein CcmD
MDWTMGGYGFYVWGSYFFAFAAIALEVYSLLKRKRACARQSEEGKPKTSHSPQASAFGSATR